LAAFKTIEKISLNRVLIWNKSFDLASISKMFSNQIISCCHGKVVLKGFFDFLIIW
jgi:hypothetical protein